MRRLPACARSLGTAPGRHSGPSRPVAGHGGAAARQPAQPGRRGPHRRPVRRRVHHLEPAAGPAAWAARLRPLATPQLARQLTQAAGTATRSGQSSTGTVTSEQARMLAPGMIILAVQVRQVTTSPSGTSQAVTSLAITLIPEGGGGWAVYDAEPASAGDAGGVPRAAP